MNKKLQKDLKKIFKLRNVLILVVLFFASLLWFKYITGIVLILVFAPITFLTVRYSKMVPHISIESNTGMSSFMGYVFGPTVGLFYGLIVGLFSYVSNSFVSLTYLSIPILGGLCAMFMAFLANLGIKFATAFAITIITRTIVAYFWYGLLGADPIERLTHQASQALTNLILYLPLLKMVYDMIAPLV